MLSEPSQKRWRQTTPSEPLHAPTQIVRERLAQQPSPDAFHTPDESFKQDAGLFAPRATKRVFAQKPSLVAIQETGEIPRREVFATRQTASLKLDKLFFVENVPTLYTGFTPNAESQPAWHAPTRLETMQRSIARLVADQPWVARLNTTRHAIFRVVADHPSIARLKTAQYSFTKRIACQPALVVLNNPRYKRVSLIGLGLIALLLVTLFAQSGMGKQTFNVIQATSFSSAPQLVTLELHPVAQRAQDINASKALARLSQLDPNQYATQDEFNTWGYSACSATAMTEVFNAYGGHYRITDVLNVESEIGEITPQLGLLENIGVARTAAKFGFVTEWGNSWTLDQVLSNANAGHPVIVSWPPERYTDGHIVVVTGGDDDDIYLADSSLWNRQEVSRTQFLQWWGGFAAVPTPE